MLLRCKRAHWNLPPVTGSPISSSSAAASAEPPRLSAYRSRDAQHNPPMVGLSIVCSRLLWRPWVRLPPPPPVCCARGPSWRVFAVGVPKGWERHVPTGAVSDAFLLSKGPAATPALGRG
jgi:hypothetical protein